MKYGIGLEINELYYSAYTTGTGNWTTTRLRSNSKMLGVLGATVSRGRQISGLITSGADR